MPARIPATIVTGFLGAGKTSLVRHLVAHAGGRRLALLINEFGDLGVDRAILDGCGIAGCRAEEVIELANGCICCTVADDFLPAMRQILGRDPAPEHILIETSGLALPKPLVRAFTWPEVRNRVTVDGVLVVADAAAVQSGRFAADPAAVQAQRAADPALDHDTPLEELFEEQLGCADLVIVNKTDLLDDAALAAAEAQIRAALRPGVRLVRTSHGRIDPRVALGLGIGAEDDLASRPSHHDGEDMHDHDDFASFVLAVPPLADPEPFAARLAATIRGHDILRVKGFLAVEAKPARHVVQAVGDRIERYYDRPWRPGEARAGALVVIGQKGLDRAAIEAALAVRQPT
jgi:cobalamin biosynthesis protein CobW